jgi:ubiquinone biosynthesis protein UbiJ
MMPPEVIEMIEELRREIARLKLRVRRLEEKGGFLK